MKLRNFKIILLCIKINCDKKLNITWSKDNNPLKISLTLEKSLKGGWSGRYKYKND